MQILLLNKLLKKIELLILTVLIIFLLACKNVFADNYNYGNFNFDDFKEQNEGYWISGCKKIDDEKKEEKCEDEIISAQEKFYTRLYKLLAKQQPDFYIDDAAIIATVFFEYDPGAFIDDTGAYDVPDWDDDINFSKETAKYLEEERDTLKTLISAMIGIKRTCYGISEPISTADGENACKDGGELKTKDGKEVCYNTFDGSISSVGKWTHFRDSGVGSFFGLSTDSANNCVELAKANGFQDGESIDDNKESVVIEGYWKFLEESTYLDKKVVLQHFYNTILTETDTVSMRDFYKLPADTRKKYDDKLLEIRKIIVKEIRSLYESYREDRPIGDYNNVTGTCDSEYIWPIGSHETTESGGATFALGEPSLVYVGSKYGMRVNPVSGIYKLHSGVDLDGSPNENGVNNVIAAKSGTVTHVIHSSTCYSQNASISGQAAGCLSGYGNYIMIQHSDGKYTLYAHLEHDTITVKVGDNVKQGQVIAKMGSSGNSTGPHLHFEVRTDQNTTVDPLDGYIDPDNPRPSAVCGPSGMDEKFMEWIVAFEGTDEYLKAIGYMVGDQYKVICPAKDVPTVGPGVTLSGCYPYFEKYGYPLATNNNYYNYCGTLFPKDLIIKIKNDVIKNDDENIKAELAKRGITDLQQYQINALIALSYNAGIDSVWDFAPNYKLYGNTQALCTNWWHLYQLNPYPETLSKRRRIECKLFTTGEYEMWG